MHALSHSFYHAHFNEFKQKSELELDAAGYWQYIDCLDCNPPVIPVLKQSQQVQGLNNTGATVTVTIPGNEVTVENARNEAETWLLADKKAHIIIVKVVAVERLYVVYDCKSAHKDPVCWRQVMVQLYQKLQDTNPLMMLDTEFAKHIITLMSKPSHKKYTSV